MKRKKGIENTHNRDNELSVFKHIHSNFYVWITYTCFNNKHLIKQNQDEAMMCFKFTYMYLFISIVDIENILKVIYVWFNKYMGIWYYILGSPNSN